MSVHEYKILCPVYTFLDIDGNICELCAGKKYLHCFTKKCNKGQTGISALAALESYSRDFFTPYEKYIDHFLMVSNSIRNKHIEYKPYFKEKSSCLYNFLDINLYQPRYKKDDYYLYFGRLSREKGVKTLIDAFKKFPNINLKIVGDGPIKPEVEEIINNHGLTNVELLGFKSGKELTDIIAGAKFSIVPSEWYETFGLIIIEAMALGTPVIGATIGAIPELIKPDHNGFLFESKNSQSLCNAITQSQSMPSEKYEAMTQSARRFVEDNFTKDKHYKTLIQKYNETIENYKKS
jgi:glycosyltransferase involved in cell wall biosynthesis